MGKIIAIHSFRGGTGKSNITANLAAQAAMANYRVGIIDTDIQTPGIHVLFGLDEKKVEHTLNEFLHGESTIEQVAYAIGEHPTQELGCKELANKKLWLIPSSINSNEISRILRDGYDVNILNQGMQSLIKNLKLDFLFLDTHPGLNEETLLSIAVSDMLFIFMRLDQQDFQGTAVAVDIARNLEVPNLLLMVNKALSRYDPIQVKEMIEKTYSVPVGGVLPFSEELADLGSRDLFSIRYPDRPWSIKIREIAQTVFNLA